MKRLFSGILYAALISMLVMGTASPTSTALAAPSAEMVNFSMKVNYPRTILRCKETVTYYVTVELARSEGAPTPVPGSLGFPKGQQVVNVEVEAFSVDKTVGDFVSTDKGTATRYTTMVFTDDLMGLEARFKFKAKKPGTTILYFQGLVGQEYVSDKVELEVLSCDYRIKANSKFSAQGITIMASMDGKMQADEQGSLTGTATVNWVGAPTAGGNCSGTIDIASSQADLTGSMDENGQLSAEVTYLPAALTHNFCCQGICATDTAQVTPDALTLSVPSSGGASGQSQGLYEPKYYSMFGSVDILVIPEESVANAFNADRRAALYRPAWLKTLWDEFPWFSSLLLALY